MYSAIAIFIVFVIWAVIELNKAKSRKENFKQLPYKIGFSFDSDRETNLVSDLATFKQFSGKYKGVMSNILTRKERTLQIDIFDYEYTVMGMASRHGGATTNTIYRSVILFQAENISLPHFILRPEGLSDKIGAVFGLQDIDFKSNPKFSKKYLLKGENEELIRKIFHPDILNYMGKDITKKVFIEGNKNRLVCYELNKLKYNNVPLMLEQFKYIYNMFIK